LIDVKEKGYGRRVLRPPTPLEKWQDTAIGDRIRGYRRHKLKEVRENIEGTHTSRCFEQLIAGMPEEERNKWIAGQRENWVKFIVAVRLLFRKKQVLHLPLSTVHWQFKTSSQALEQFWFFRFIKDHVDNRASLC
jgi:hypothetical protein